VENLEIQGRLMKSPASASADRRSICREFDRALWPKTPDGIDPARHGPAEISAASILSSSDLRAQSILSEQRNADWTSHAVSPPRQPHIEIERAWRMKKRPHNIAVYGNRMGLNLGPESLTQNNRVSAKTQILWPWLSVLRPETDPFEKSKS
jgi:hypothetical protein